MAGLRAILGLYPQTNAYELKQLKVEEEYKAISEFENSTDYKRYTQLNNLIQSEDFLQKKKELFGFKFENTEEYKQEKEFFRLRKTKEIDLFYKTKGSKALIEFQETEKSAELTRFIDLEKFVLSPEFAEIKKLTSQSSSKKFAASDLSKTLIDYEQKSTNSKIKSYLKFISDKAFNGYNEIVNSGLDKKADELSKYFGSSEFQIAKKSLKGSEFKASEAGKKQEEYSRIQNSKAYKGFLKLNRSGNKSAYSELYGSKEIGIFLELKKFVESDDFRRQKKEIESRSFKDTHEYKRFQEYNQLKNSSRIKQFLKFRESVECKNYFQLLGTEKIKDFEKLKANIESESFVEKKRYTSQSPKKRWNESELHKQQQEFEQLADSPKIKWYFKARSDKKFSWNRQWKTVFIEDFTGNKLDTDKWISRYYWGDELLKDTYSLTHDKHFITDGKNINIKDSNLVISTKQEKANGKSWHPKFGFVVRDFNFTSGLINTGKSFRQLYGTFEAKIKIHESHDIQNAFWMVSKSQLPHIDVMKANGKVVLGNAWGNSKDTSTIKAFRKTLGRNKFASDYFIYTLVWTKDKLTWKINGLEVASTQKGVPQEAMYLVLSSGMNSENLLSTPAEMQVDWVKCYGPVGS